MTTEKKLRPGMLVRYADGVTPLVLIQQLPRRTQIGHERVEWRFLAAGRVEIEQYPFLVSLFEIISTPDTLKGE